MASFQENVTSWFNDLTAKAGKAYTDLTDKEAIEGYKNYLSGLADNDKIKSLEDWSNDTKAKGVAYSEEAVKAAQDFYDKNAPKLKGIVGKTVKDIGNSLIEVAPKVDKVGVDIVDAGKGFFSTTGSSVGAVGGAVAGFAAGMLLGKSIGGDGIFGTILGFIFGLIGGAFGLAAGSGIGKTIGGMFNKSPDSEKKTDDAPTADQSKTTPAVEKPSADISDPNRYHFADANFDNKTPSLPATVKSNLKQPTKDISTTV